MIQTQFSKLIKLYRRAAEGESIEELELFASAVSFLENLKFSLQDEEITRQAGMAMIELLSQHSAAYDRFLEEQKKKGVYRSPKSPKEIDQRKELKVKLGILAKDLAEFFKHSEDKPSQKITTAPPAVRKKPRRLSRPNWIRS